MSGLFLLPPLRPYQAIPDPEEIKTAFEEARKNTKTPTLIEFIIDPEDLVYPMVKPGGALEELLMDC